MHFYRTYVNVSSMNRFYSPNGDCGQAGSAWRGVQRASCPLQNNVNLNVLLDEEQATAVRPLKTQNDMRQKNLEKIGCKFEHENRANSVAFSPARFVIGSGRMYCLSNAGMFMLTGVRMLRKERSQSVSAKN